MRGAVAEGVRQAQEKREHEGIVNLTSEKDVVDEGVNSSARTWVSDICVVLSPYPVCSE